MKKRIQIAASVCLILFAAACNPPESNEATKAADNTSANASSVPPAGQSGVQDNESAKNVVQIAVGSKDHTTLVTAVKAADLVDALSNAGPFTVFAPTNAAFDKLPAGTVEGLLKPAKKDDLKNILEYHVSLGVFKLDALQDGQVLGQVNGGNATIHIKDGKTYINDAQIIASIPASNGIVHVIDGVILPPAK
jgi:uncharacterized surface protein with fasciclin (FAS1) repeats